MLEQRIKATFGQYQVPAVVHAVQGDTGRVFIFESQDRQITGTETAALMCIRPDGTAFSYSGTVDPDLNEITVALDIDGGALSQAGVVAAQLVMQENGQVLCSFKLGIIVEEALGGEATPEDITFLDGLQAQLDAWIASAGSNFVPSTRTVNGKALSSNITINAEDVPYDNTASGLTADDVQEAVDELALKEDQLESTKANKSTTINGKSLEADRVIYAQDIPSKNLLPNTATTQTINGVTFTVNSDGSITANGTASANTFLNLISANFSIPSGQYILSGCPEGGHSASSGSNDNYLLRLLDSAGESFVVDIGSGAEFTMVSGRTINAVAIRIASGFTANNLVFKPMIRLASIEDAEYVPYAKTNEELSTFKTATITLPWGNTMNIVKSGNIVQGTLAGQVPSQINGNTTSAVALPSEFMPLIATELVMIHGNTPSTYLGGMVINTDGTLYNRLAIPANTYLRGSATWITR